MKRMYMCETCGTAFYLLTECLEHETACKEYVLKSCYKCGKIQSIVLNDSYESQVKFEGWHNVNLERPGYGSTLDGCDVEFEICDKCLRNFIESFPIEYQEKIFNSGDNCDESPEEWLDRNK